MWPSVRVDEQTKSRRLRHTPFSPLFYVPMKPTGPAPFKSRSTINGGGRFDFVRRPGTCNTSHPPRGPHGDSTCGEPNEIKKKRPPEKTIAPVDDGIRGGEALEAFSLVDKLPLRTHRCSSSVRTAACADLRGAEGGAAAPQRSVSACRFHARRGGGAPSFLARPHAARGSLQPLPCSNHEATLPPHTSL